MLRWILCILALGVAVAEAAAAAFVVNPVRVNLGADQILVSVDF